MKHQAGKRHDMQAGHRFRRPFVVPDQAADAACLREIALDHPPARHHRAAALGLGQLHNFQHFAARCSR